MKKFSASIAGSVLIAAGLLTGSLTAAAPAGASEAPRVDMSDWECGLPAGTGYPAGRVYSDANGNGKFDQGEGVEDVTVFITWPEGYGNSMNSARTDEMGIWRSQLLSPSGEYTVEAGKYGLPKGLSAPDPQPASHFPALVHLSDDVVHCGGHVDRAAWDIALTGKAVVSEQTPVKINLTDIAEGSRYFDAVSWLVAEGITTGYKDGSFRPDQTITRGEMAQMLYRMAGDR